jgi:hypothetical protein
MLIRYFNKILKFNLKKSFILYWQRYYVYHLKRFFVFIEYTISKYFNYIIKKFKFYFSFINLKKINKK